MLDIDMLHPKAEPIPYREGMYILSLWKKAKTHFMVLILKKREKWDTHDRQKLSLVFRND